MSTTVNNTSSTNYIDNVELNWDEVNQFADFNTCNLNNQLDTADYQDGSKTRTGQDKKFKPAPAKVKDHESSENNTKFKSAPAKAKENEEISDKEKELIEKSNEYTKNNTNINLNERDNIISSDPSFILARFRSGDPELFKLLSDPALGPVLMAKIQDAAAAETRLHTLLSNLQKSKDDTLKAIVNNIR